MTGEGRPTDVTAELKSGAVIGNSISSQVPRMKRQSGRRSGAMIQRDDSRRESIARYPWRQLNPPRLPVRSRYYFNYPPNPIFRALPCRISNYERCTTAFDSSIVAFRPHAQVPRDRNQPLNSKHDGPDLLSLERLDVDQVRARSGDSCGSIEYLSAPHVRTVPFSSLGRAPEVFRSPARRGRRGEGSFPNKNCIATRRPALFRGITRTVYRV